MRALFNRIAGIYDLLNGVMSAGLHHGWRRRAADLAALAPGDRVLDVAAGTGDLTIELATRVGPEGEAVGCDFSEDMLARARIKGPGLRFEIGDALALDYADGEFLPRLSGSPHGTSPTWNEGCPRWSASCGRVAEW